MARSAKILVALVLCCSLLSGCASLIPEDMADQVLTFDDLTISLPVYFEDMTDTGNPIPTEGFFVYGYSEIMITGLRDDKSLFETVPTLEEYGKTLIAQSDVTTELEVIDGLTTFTYYQLYNNESYTYTAFLFEGTDSFWMVQAGCKTMNFKYVQEKLFEICKTIRVA